jgi:Ca2+-binding EF-hand superfamily protein
MKEIEDAIKERLSNGWVSVRKAFLDLDENYDGSITAEEFAKLLGGCNSSNKFDFNLLKMLIRMRTEGKSSKINYSCFSNWFGNTIEPVETFYFRHDSHKNPQYEKNLTRQETLYSKGQKKVREIISNDDIRQKFLNKVHSNYKTLSKAFYEMNSCHSGVIKFDEFTKIMKLWGFEASPDVYLDLFEWLDTDKDSKITFEDLRSSAGK